MRMTEEEGMLSGNVESREGAEVGEGKRAEVVEEEETAGDVVEAAADGSKTRKSEGAGAERQGRTPESGSGKRSAQKTKKMSVWVPTPPEKRRTIVLTRVVESLPR